MNLKGNIFDIQSFSVHDGPGCRTTVFFNGCPLQCRWCANPESWKIKSHIMFSELSCKYDKGCTACNDKCKNGGLTFDDSNKPILNWDICKACTTFECAKSCYNNALKICSKEYSVEELMEIIKRDSNNWRSKGGVTFSGGEPLIHHEYLINILKECKKINIHTAIETSAYVSNDIFLNIMNYIDFAFIDLKHMDREKHKSQTGVYNDLIHQNIKLLKKCNWNGRLVIRVPVIGGFNDDDDNVYKIIDFMKENDLYEINLLPFHRLGESKWIQLGEIYDYNDKGDVDLSKLEEIQDKFLDNEIACYIGHETMF